VNKADISVLDYSKMMGYLFQLLLYFLTEYAP